MSKFLWFVGVVVPMIAMAIWAALLWPPVSTIAVVALVWWLGCVKPRG